MNAEDVPDDTTEPIALPWTFDTTTVWRMILKAAFVLNGVLALGLVYKLALGQWLDAGGVALVETVAAAFTLILYRFQRGFRGTVYADRVEVLPSAVAGIRLPGPRGVYAMENFRGIRTEYWMGRASTDPNISEPHEDIWLVGKAGTPDVMIAQNSVVRRGLGKRFGTLLNLPVEETRKPTEIHLGGDRA